MNIQKRIEQLKNQLNVNESESVLQSIVRKQRCLTWWYGHKDTSQAEMESFAQQNAQTPEQERDNLRIFMNLTDEKINGRKFEAQQGGLR